MGLDLPPIAQPPGFTQLPLQHHQVLGVACFAQRAVQQRAQHWPLQRLFDVPERAGFDCRNGAFFASFSGDDHRGNAVKLIAKLLQQVQPVHSGQFDIGNQRVRLERRKFCESVFGGSNAKHFIAPALQQLFVALAGVVFILDDQNTVFALARIHRAYSLAVVAHAPLPRLLTPLFHCRIKGG